VAEFLEATGVAPSGKLQYGKDLSAVLSRMGHSLPITRMYMSGLRSSGALVPTEQAFPISEDQVRRGLQLAEEQGNHKMRAALFVAFKTASRWSDVSRLQRKAFRIISPTQIGVRWGAATKTTTTDAFAIRAMTIIEHPPGMQWLIDFLQPLRPDEFFVAMSTDRATAWLKENLPADSADRQVTASSIKRGAVTTLVCKAAQYKLSPELISRLAKHKMDLEEISATTIRYVSEEVWDQLALLLRTQEATRLLLA
jgi:hypothetical protein